MLSKVLKGLKKVIFMLSKVLKGLKKVIFMLSEALKGLKNPIFNFQLSIFNSKRGAGTLPLPAPLH